MSSHNSKTLDSKSDDESTIRNLYQQMIDGWNGGNGNAFAAPYTDDGYEFLYLYFHILSPIEHNKKLPYRNIIPF